MDRVLADAEERLRAEQAARIDWASLTAETFLESADYCDLAISPAQRALARAAEGLPVVHLDPFDLDYFLGTRGPFAPPRRPAVVAVRAGRRGGKSLIAMLLLMLHALRVKLRREPRPGETPERDGLVGVGNGERVRLAIVAARMSQSIGTFELALARLGRSPRLGKYLVRKGATSATLRRDDGQEIHVEILAAAERGTNLRAGWFIGAVVDEADFVGEQDEAVSLADQINAVRPALVDGGQVWLCTSPWDDSGQFAKLHAAAWGNPTDIVAYHSSSQRMNPLCNIAEIEEQRKRDPDYVSREFDANPMIAGGDQFFPENALVAACTIPEPFKLPPNGAPHWGGCDVGWRKNSSAVAFARHDAGKVVLAYYEELIPQKKSAEQTAADIKLGTPPGLSPSVVLKSFARTALQYKCSSIRGDQWYDDTSIEQMATVKNEVGDSVWYDTYQDNAKSTAEIFTKLRSLLNDGKARLPRDLRLMTQMRGVKTRKGPSGEVHISLPRTGAAHGDLLKAVVLAMVQVPLEIEEEIEEEPYDTFGMSFDEGRGF